MATPSTSVLAPCSSQVTVCWALGRPSVTLAVAQAHGDGEATASVVVNLQLWRQLKKEFWLCNTQRAAMRAWPPERRLWQLRIS